MAPTPRLQRHLVLLLGAASLACAPATRPGEDVRIGEESAIIIWDAQTKTEHFIRRASFQTKANDFGFLVPTPTIPKLEEADDDAFRLLAKITAPEAVTRWVVEGSETPKAAPEFVRVIATATVAGYDAVILDATDAEALNRWLNDHGYAASPELVDWFRPYLERKWKISAFKISGERPTRAVRMSFQTDKPFFPYREPAMEDRGETDRLLRVYFLGESRYDGTIGTDSQWPGQTVWSNLVDQDNRAQLLRLAKLPPDTAPKALWLTEIEDRSAPRKGTDDVYFSAIRNRETVKRRDDVTYVYYSQYWLVGFGIAVLAGLLSIAYFVVRRIRRKS
jgi:Uncharacterized protein conserved in bacteria (DUF2330)